MSGRHARVSLVVLPLLVLTACASQGQAQTGAPSDHTLVKTLHVYRPDGELTVRVADVGFGHCWTMSIAAPTSGAYRCLSGNAILDPCFRSPKASKPLEVACVADPWSEAKVLQINGALPEPVGKDGPQRPWALELGNGTRCVAATGMVPSVDGVNLGYHCGGGHDAGALDTARSLATAKYAQEGAKALSSVTITTIWHA